MTADEKNWYNLPLLMTLEEVADLLRCSERTVLRMRERGEIDDIGRAGRLLFRRDDVAALAGVDVSETCCTLLANIWERRTHTGNGAYTVTIDGATAERIRDVLA